MIAPAITSRRALVFLDQDPPARRPASALRSSGYAVETCQAGRRDHERLAEFLGTGAPRRPAAGAVAVDGDVVGADFATLVKRFGASAGESTASAVLMIVDFGWIGSASPTSRPSAPCRPVGHRRRRA